MKFGKKCLKTIQKLLKTMKKQQKITFLKFLFFYFISISSIEAQDQNQFGFAGDREQTFIAGSPESVTIWKQWCALHEKGDVEGITALASENIRIEAPGGEFTIDGKEELTSFLTQWFEVNEEVRAFPEWGVPLKFINQEGNPIDGDWVTSGFSLQINNGTETTVEQNHANVYIENGKIQYFRVLQYKVDTLAEVTLSVDLSSYDGNFSIVGVFGSFNDWCGSCNPMVDEDGDGVYTTTIQAIPGELQYKFILDEQGVEENFKSGDPCTTTIDIYTNRVLQVEGNMTIDPVCFNSCSSCE